MTREETKHYALHAVLRAAIREDFVSKLGRLKHSIETYERLINGTIPVTLESNLQDQSKFFLLLLFDLGTDIEDIIENKLIPYVDKNLKSCK